jgi:hypothetical protein
MEPTQFLNHLKDTAASPFAFVAYLAVVGAWAYIIIARHRLTTIAKTLNALPEDRRAEILLKEYNTTPRKGLSAEQWIRARKHVLILVSFLATLIAALAIAGMALFHPSVAAPRAAQLAVVDVQASETEHEGLVEFKVRNNSDEVIFIKRAEFLTLAQWDLPQPGTYPEAVPISQTYDVRLSGEVGQVVAYNISQGLTPNSVDRFAFRIATEHKRYPFIGLFIFMIKIKLVYNEDNREVESPNVLLNLPPPMEPLAAYVGNQPLPQLEANKTAALNILHRMGRDAVCSDSLMKAIRSWAYADFSRSKP